MKDSKGGHSQRRGQVPRGARQYWKANIRLVLVLLGIWFAVSYGAGILWRDWLDQFRLGGFKLGFWFAQQGSIYVFVILIFVYVFAMNHLDDQYGYGTRSSK